MLLAGSWSVLQCIKSRHHSHVSRCLDFHHFFILFLFFPLLLPSVKNSKAATVGANVNKAQEDLAKARKLIKSMRSLEKSASKPSQQSSTANDGPRLHQVASSKRSVDKEGSQRYFKIGMQNLKSSSGVTIFLFFNISNCD